LVQVPLPVPVRRLALALLLALVLQLVLQQEQVLVPRRASVRLFRPVLAQVPSLVWELRLLGQLERFRIPHSMELGLGFRSQKLR